MSEEQNKKDQAFKAEHMSFPDPRCQVWFKDTLEPIVKAITLSAAAMDSHSEKLERVIKTVHGTNYDNGLSLSVRELITEVEKLSTLPETLRKEMMTWGFKLIGLNVIGNGIAIAIIVWLIKGGAS